MKFFIKNCFLFIFLFLFIFGCSNSSTKKGVGILSFPVPAPITVAKITPNTVVMEYIGNSGAINTINVKARVQGFLEKTFFNDGDFVKRGDVLFLIEQDNYIAEVNAAKAQLDKDRASLEIAKINVESYKPLVKEGLSPELDFKTLLANVEELEAQVESDKAALAQAELNLKYTTIKSPISGIVGESAVDDGNFINGQDGTVLVTVVQRDPVYIYFYPNSTDVSKSNKFSIKMGDRVEVIAPPTGIDSNPDGNKYYGKVSFFDNVIDEQTGTIKLRATVSDENMSLYPGTFVNVDVILSDKYSFLAIPRSAVNGDQQGQYVYILDSNSTAKRVNIKTNYSNNSVVEVVSGLKSGDRVVVGALSKVREGSKIIPLPPGGIPSGYMSQGSTSYKQVGAVPSSSLKPPTAKEDNTTAVTYGTSSSKSGK